MDGLVDGVNEFNHAGGHLAGDVSNSFPSKYGR